MTARILPLAGKLSEREAARKARRAEASRIFAQLPEAKRAEVIARMLVLLVQARGPEVLLTVFRAEDDAPKGEA